MPASVSENQEPILNEISKQKENIRILDVGMGWGNFGKLIKEAFPNKKINLTGVEVWPKYKNWQWNFYDNVIISDINQCLTSLKYFDVILALDVIEHFTRDQGVKLIKELKKKTKNLLVSVPIIDFPQGAYEGNPYETHRYQWKTHEMLTLGAESLLNGQVIGVFKFKGSFRGKLKSLFLKNYN